MDVSQIIKTILTLTLFMKQLSLVAGAWYRVGATNPPSPQLLKCCATKLSITSDEGLTSPFMGYPHGCFFSPRAVYVTWEKLLFPNAFLGNPVDTAGETGGVSTGAWGIPLWPGKKFSLGDGIMKADDSKGVGGNPFIAGDIGSLIIEHALRRWVESFLGLGFSLFNWSRDFVRLLRLDGLPVYSGSMISTLGGSLPPFRATLSGTVNLVFVTTVWTRRGELSLSTPSPNKRKQQRKISFFDFHCITVNRPLIQLWMGL